MKIAEKIRKMREERDYSQEYMAGKLKISQPSYARLESGGTKFSIDRLEEIAKLLDVKFADIISYGEQTKLLNMGAGDHNNPSDTEHLAMTILELEVKDLRTERDRLLGIIEKMAK